MQKNISSDVAEYAKNNRFRNAWRKVVRGLACGVVFCTTYALILPAITMEQKSYCGYEEHVHTQECYRQIEVPSELICPLVEVEAVANVDVETNANVETNVEIEANANVETDADETVLEPGSGEEIIHSVSDSDAEAFGDNVVQQEEPLIHTHTEECYAVAKEPPLTCELAEGEEHAHNFLCYGSWELTCTKEEHAHALSCFSDPEADVEVEGVWERTIANMELYGVWTEDVVAIAKSQLGYTESARNYAVCEDGSTMGYTRYGAWSGTPYGEWEAMFASFCIHYAGVENMPLNSDSDAWMKELSAENLYQEAANYNPQPSDLLFLDQDGDGLSDGVGIVVEMVPATEESVEQVKTIQGNIANQVQYVTYELGDARIMGYGVLPKQPAPTLLYTYSDDNVQVEVKLPEGTRVPKDAVLSVKPIYAESEGYDQLLNQAEAAIDGMVERIQFYDISFYTLKQEYIPVSDRAQVTMRFADKVVDSTENTVVLHYDENDSAPVVLDNVNIDEQTLFVAGKSDVSGTVVSALQVTPVETTNTVVTFATDGFSVFAVVEVESGVYETQVLNDYTNLAGKTYMIITNSDIINNSLDNGVDTRVALKAKVVSVNQLGGTEDTSYEKHTGLEGVEVVYTDFDNVATNNPYRGTLSSVKDPGLLWTFSSSAQGVSIQSVSTQQYLSINNGTLELSSNLYTFQSTVVNGSNAIRLGSGNNYISFYSQEERPNQEKINVFTATYGNNNTHNDLLLAEYTEASSEVERVTNLAGKIAMIVAVNNDEYTQDGVDYYSPAKALSSEIYGEDGKPEHALIATEMTTSPQNGRIEFEDTANNLAWEFEASDEPGFYYIKVANVYGDDKPNPNKGKYIYFVNGGGTGQNRVRDLRLGDDSQKQKIEVVKGIVEGNYPVKEVVCLRTNINGNYYYLQLGMNHSNWPIYNSGQHESNENPNSNSITFAGNHFVIAELSDGVVNEINERIDQLPTSMDEFNAWVDAKGNFETQIAYRKELQKIAKELKENYGNTAVLTDMQKNFIGEKRMEKLEKLEENLGFLLKDDPKEVPAAEPNATIKLFNYGPSINETALATNPKIFQFYSWDDVQKTVDGYIEDGNITTRPPVMASTLENGYPKIIGYYPEDAQTYTQVDNGSLAYLFSDDYLVNKNGEAMSKGGGLFRQDEDGYYYYFSDTNAAWYDKTKNKFMLYDVVIRPEYTLDRSGLDNDMISNFLPFNEVKGNIIYDNEWSDSRVGDKTETAYLNSKTDLWFGMMIEYDFFIPKDALVYTEENGVETPQEMVFEFHGDDDVFVYIDDVLVLDIGGTHGARDGSINFTTGEVTYQTSFQDRVDDIYDVEDVNTNLATLFNEANVEADFDDETPERFADYTMHNLKFFYLERGGTYSYAGIRFNMPTIPENSLLVGKELRKEDNQEIIDAELNYTFRIVDANDTSKSFVDGKEPYIIYEGGQYEGIAYVDEDGYFTLKAGQRALFPGLLDPSRENTEFYVQEIMPANVDGQYSVAYYEGGNNISALTPGSKTEDGKVVYQTQIYTTDKDKQDYTYTTSVIFENNISGKRLDTLNIKKLAGAGNTITPPDKKFKIEVKVGNDETDLIPLPEGTKYIVKKEGNPTGNDGVVDDKGIIRLGIGETATIQGFLAGTYWTIEEVLTADEHFMPVYFGEAEIGTIDESYKAGTFGVEDTVSFTVTNYACDFMLDVDIVKQAIGNTGNASFNFDVKRGTWKQNGGTYEWQEQTSLNDTNVFVKDSEPATGKVVLGFYNTDEGSYYYRISEQRGTDEFIYDDTFYILEVMIEGEGDDKSARVSKIWKNGTEELNDMTSALPLSFINYKSTTLTVDKTVVNASDQNDTDGTFQFEATVTLEGGTTFTSIPESVDKKYTVDANGVITFQLEHGEKVEIPVPLNATVTVTEANTPGYSTSYQIGQDSVLKSGTTATVQEINNPVAVHFINKTGYELPATGGTGTHLYTLSGVILLFTAAGLLYLRKRTEYN